MRSKFNINNFTLFYSESDNGGGTSIGLDFKNVLNKHHPNRKFNRCLEWCSGPGFIGFDLLLNDLCKELVLVDKHQSALNSVTNSLSQYNGELQVTTYCIDKISNLPGHEQFDLVVANPPHFSFPVFYQETIFKNDSRIYLDYNWDIHKEFFANIHNYLNPNGIILLQESSWGSNYNTFDSFLCNLKMSNYYSSVNRVKDYPIFYIEYMHL